MRRVLTPSHAAAFSAPFDDGIWNLKMTLCQLLCRRLCIYVEIDINEMLGFQILLLCETNTAAFSAPFGICSAGGEICAGAGERFQELGRQSHARVVHFRINLDEF